MARCNWLGAGVLLAVGCGGPGETRGSGTVALTFSPTTNATTGGETGSETDVGSTSSGMSTPVETGGDGTSTTAATDGGSTTIGEPMVVCPPQGAMSCAPAPGPGCDLYGKIESCFAGKVATAVSETITENPTWFQEQENGDTLVLPEFKDPLVDTVVAKMQAHACTQRDPMDGDGIEIAIKHNDEFQESFRLVTSWGTVRKGLGSYVGTCAPAFL